jgi:hypothetical protein
VQQYVLASVLALQGRAKFTDDGFGRRLASRSSVSAQRTVSRMVRNGVPTFGMESITAGPP